jgi:hypothetical protein
MHQNTVPGITAHFDTTSGKVNYDMPLVKEGSTYTCGDGSGDVKINTTSGNITVVPLWSGFFHGDSFTIMVR